MKLGRAIAALFAAPAVAQAAPAGTYTCLTEHIRWYAGTRAGETAELVGGDLQLDVITDQNLLWQYDDGNSVHNGLPLEIEYKPEGREELFARVPGGMAIRIVFDREPMTFAALDTKAVLTGTCYFKPRETP